MPSRFAFWTFIAVAAIARPCLAQKVISKHPPLSPDEAVRVLRSSHSLADMANRPLIDPDGPHVYVLPYDPSVDAIPMMAAPDMLAPDGIPLLPYGGYGGAPYGMFGSVPYGGMFGGAPFAPFAPFGGFAASSPFQSRGHARPLTATPRVRPMAPAPAPPASRSIVAGAAVGGMPARRR